MPAKVTFAEEEDEKKRKKLVADVVKTVAIGKVLGNAK